MATVKKVKKYQKSGPPLTVTRAGKFKKQTFETDTTGYSAGKKSFPTKVTTVGINKSGEETPMKNSPRMMNVGRGAVEEQLGQKEKMKKQMEGKMKKGGKIKKAQAGMTMKQLKMKYPSADTTAKGDVRGSEMNASAPKKVLDKFNDTYNAFEKKFGNKPAKNKMGGKIKKAQTGKKLPLGASSASAESDYAKSDSLRNVANKMTGKDFFEMARSKKPNPRIQSDSLRAEGNRKTKATGGVSRENRFKMGGKVSKMMSKMKSKMSKKK